MTSDWLASSGASWPGEAFPADWAAYDRAAGPIRNARMIAEGKPDIVLAFPGGRGTANMVAQARKAGVRVIEIAPKGRRQRREGRGAGDATEIATQLAGTRRDRW